MPTPQSHHSAGITPLTGVAFRKGDGSLLAAGQKDGFTAPAGKRAFVRAGYLYNASLATVTLYHLLKTADGVYHRLTADYALPAGTAAGWGSNFPTFGECSVLIVLEPGETITLHATGAVTALYAVIEYDAGNALYSPRLLALAAGDNVLGLCPPGKAWSPLSGGGTTSGPKHWCYFSGTGGARTVTANYVPAGGSPASTNRIVHFNPTPGVSVAVPSGTRSLLNVPNLSAFDSLHLSTDGGGGDEAAWGIVSEVGTGGGETAFLFETVAVTSPGFPPAFLANMAAGDNDLPPIPAGQGCAVKLLEVANPSAGAVRIYGTLKRQGVTLQVTPAATVAANGWGSFFFVLIGEPGDVPSVHCDLPGANAWLDCAAFDLSAGVRTVWATGPPGQDTLLYRAPAASFALANALDSGFWGIVYHANASGAPVTVRYSQQPSGSAAPQIISAALSVADNVVNQQAIGGSFAGGDDFLVNASGGTAWMNVMERPLPLTWSQDRYLTDTCDILVKQPRTTGANKASQEHGYSVIQRSVRYLHISLPNQDDPVEVAAVGRPNLFTRDLALFPKGAAVPDACIIRHTTPESDMTGFCYEVLGLAQPFNRAGGIRRIGEAMYGLRITPVSPKNLPQ